MGGWRRARGTAEIETLLVIPLFITMLLLAGGNLVLGGARIKNVFGAETAAYRDATVAPDPTLADGGKLQPLDAFPSLPTYGGGLPNRVHVSDAQAQSAGFLNGPGVTLVDREAFIAPAWSLSAYPVEADGQVTAAWFEGYAGEARDAISQPLGLSPSSPP